MVHTLKGCVEPWLKGARRASCREPHHIPGGPQRRGPACHHVAQLTAQPVAPHRIACRSANGIAHMGNRDVGVDQTGHPKSINARISSFPLQAPKDALLGNSSYQAERRWRPLARRDFSTARPARVLMRWRKPCFLDRRRLFGWKVRFMDASSIRRQCISAVVSKNPH